METEEAIRLRYSERAFSDKPVTEQLIMELLRLAQRAPSGLNIQPWRFVAVFDEKKRAALLPICIDQIQVKEAPCVVVFIADPLAWKDDYSEVLNIALREGSIDETRQKRYSNLANFLFRVEPLGLFGIVKKVIVPLRRIFIPTPRVVSSTEERKAYIRSHTMLCAATFMLAASSRGLATCPMEGFDEARLKRLLNIPSRMTIPLIVPVGYARGDTPPVKTARLSLESIYHVDAYRS